MKIFTLTALLLIACGWSSAQSKLAHLNSRDVLVAMPEYNKAMEDLKKFEDDGYAELEAMYTQLQNDAKSLEERMIDLTPVIRQIEEEKLNKKQQQLIEREEALKLEVDAYSRELNTPIMAKFNNAVKVVADREKFDYVFDVSMSLVHNGTDITKLVIAEVLKGTTTAPPPPQED